MLKNHLFLDGQEFLYSPRTLGYIKKNYPYIEVKCDDETPALDSVLIPGGVSDPVADGAPWVTSGSATSGEFFGGVINTLEGLYDSTQVGNSTELKDYGAVHHAPHFSAREILVAVTLYASTDRGLRFGLDWLKSVIDNSFCGTGFGADCNGMSLQWYTVDSSSASQLYEVLDVKVLQGVKEKGRPQHRELKAMEVEFILMAGSPFVFNMTPSWTASNIEDGTAATSVTETTCDPQDDAYDELVTDPADGVVARPPRPPAINPLPMPATWTNRVSLSLPESLTEEWAQVVFHVSIEATTVRRQVRLRVYPDSSTPGGCDYSGEMYFTYIPAGSTIHVDGRTREIYLMKSGKRIPASNLVLGSAGRPLKWPVVDCRTPHRIEVDVLGSRSGMNVTVKAYLRR